MRSSKRLSNRKEVLKAVDPLLLALARWAGLYARIQQILISAFETEILRAVDAVPQIHAQRPHRRLVAYAEAHRVHHVIEILYIALLLAQGEIIQIGVDIAHIVEEHAADIVADQWKPKLRLIEHQEIAAQRKSRGVVARARLAFREGAMRAAAAAEEALRQRDGGRRIARVMGCDDIANFGAARQHQLLADGVVGGIAQQEAHEIDLRPEGVVRQPEIHRVVDAFVRIHRVVAAVQNPPERDDSHAHPLRKHRAQHWRY